MKYLSAAGPGGQAPITVLVEQLLQLFRLTRRILARSFAEEGGDLRLSELMVVWTLAGGEPARLTDLSRHLGIPASTLTSLVDRLEERGYVRRRRADDDRRVVFVAAAPGVDECRARVASVLRRHLEPALAALAPGDAEGLVRNLEQLTQALVRGQPAADTCVREAD